MAKISVFGMNAAYHLGFKGIADVRGVRSIRHLFRDARFLSGIYLQIRPGKCAYIGQALHMPRRFEQHLARGAVIEELAFKEARVTDLANLEKKMIELAEKKGIPIENIALTEIAPVENPVKFEEVLDEQTCQDWLSASEENSGRQEFLKIYDAINPGLRHRFDLARSHPVWPQVFPVAVTFVEEVIPKPVDTRGLFWNSNAYTSQPEESFIPLIRLYAGSQNILGLGYYQFERSKAWGWVNVASDSIGNLDELIKALPVAKIEVKEKVVEISASADFLPFVIEKTRPALRATALKWMKTSVMQKGNQALEALLTDCRHCGFL